MSHHPKDSFALTVHAEEHTQCASRSVNIPFDTRFALTRANGNSAHRIFTYPLLNKLFLVCVSFIFCPFALALPNDGEQPMKIVADASLFNYKTGVDTYEGNVKVDQGTTHLIADKLVTEKNEQHKIVSAIAYGTHHLAELTTLPSIDAQILHAKSTIIKFYPSTSILVLENNVVVTQGENSFHGSHIIYNMKEQMVAAPASKNGRATIVIDAKTKKS